MGGYSQTGPAAGEGAGSSPGGTPGSAGPVSDTGAQAAQPSTQGDPRQKAALGQLTSMAQTARTYAQAYPQCAPEMRQIGELLQKCLMKTVQNQKGSEPPTPPV